MTSASVLAGLPTLGAAAVQIRKQGEGFALVGRKHDDALKQATCLVGIVGYSGMARCNGSVSQTLVSRSQLARRTVPVSSTLHAFSASQH